MTRKLVLLVALISTMGMSCGWLTEDLCSLDGSSADDPSAPTVAAQYALPKYSRGAPKAPKTTAPLVAAAMPFVAAIMLAAAPAVSEGSTSAAAPLQNPRRC